MEASLPMRVHEFEVIKPDICRSLYPSQNGIKLGNKKRARDQELHV